jgi:predicted nucleic-acid-binding protein
VPRRKKAEERQPLLIHLLDTNVILRFLIGDDPTKAARATGLMKRVERGQEIVDIPEEVLTETVWTLESFYKVPRAETARHLAGLLSFSGVRTHSRGVLIQALQGYASSNADFVDCMLAARSQHRKVPVYTFDQTDFKTLEADWEMP